MKCKKKHKQIWRSPMVLDRIRRIEGGFCFIPHRFLQDGFFVSLSQHELLLYFFLVLAGDSEGVSFYRYDSICTMLFFRDDEYIEARNGLIDKDLIAFDGRLYQVLSLPDCPVQIDQRPLQTSLDFEEHDPATIHKLVCRSLGINEKDQ
ncbi:MAG: hypothetical protein GY845_22300 [Planctomycetes bacterium]|nr:hypothetical protein [Planctomycetota bacterium]